MTLSSPLKTVCKSGSIIVRGSGAPSQYFPALTNGTDIFITAAITFQSETNKEDVDLAASGERVDGIVYGAAFPAVVDLDKDSDDCYANNKWIRCYKPMPRDEIYATVATATSITKDDWVKYADGFLTGATNKNDAIGKLANGGTAITAVSGQEQVCTIEWGTD